MKKKILSFMTVVLLTGSVCITAFAEGESGHAPVQRDRGTKAELKSYGRIVYQKGADAVRIDSDDLYRLADRMDQMKLAVTEQLRTMNTYFTADKGEITLSTSGDIHAAHAKPCEEDLVDPLEIKFDTLLEGIAVSQSVSTDVTAYGYPAGTELYKNGKGILITGKSEEGAEPIGITAASADNLSAGTAAWIDGKLLLGTGKDSRSYYEKGYKEAYGKISEQFSSVDFVKYGGSLRVYNEEYENNFLGPCDIFIPNEDVWLFLPGYSAGATFEPKSDVIISGYMFSMQQYKKDPDLPDDAMRKLHLTWSRQASLGPFGADWYLLYLK